MPSYFDSPQYKNSPAGRGSPLTRTPQFNTPFGSPGSNFGSGGSPFSGFGSPFSMGGNATFPQGSGGGLTSSAPLGFDTMNDVAPDPFKQGPMQAQSGNVVGRVIDWAKGNPKDALSMAGNVANTVLQYQQMQKQNRLAEREAKLREEEIQRRRRNEESMSPARAQVLQMLLGNLK